MQISTQASPRETRPAGSEYAPYYGKYISKVSDGDIIAALERQFADSSGLLRDASESKGSYRYAEGKWSVREVIGHIADAERVFCYRALRFARGDSTPLPGFDENQFVANARFDAQTIKGLIDEWEAVRLSTVRFLRSLSAEEWLRGGTASDNYVSVRGLAWIIAGHENHHMELLRTRYGIGSA